MHAVVHVVVVALDEAVGVEDEDAAGWEHDVFGLKGSIARYAQWYAAGFLEELDGAVRVGQEGRGVPGTGDQAAGGGPVVEA